MCVLAKQTAAMLAFYTALLWSVFGVTAVVLDIRATVTAHPRRSKRHATDET